MPAIALSPTSFCSIGPAISRGRRHGRRSCLCRHGDGNPTAASGLRNVAEHPACRAALVLFAQGAATACRSLFVLAAGGPFG